MNLHLSSKARLAARVAILAGWAGLMAGACGCVMAARKGAQRVEKRGGPVGELLTETKDALHGGSGKSSETQAVSRLKIRERSRTANEDE